MMGACGADDDVGVLLRQKFKKQRFQMIDDSAVSSIDRCAWPTGISDQRNSGC
jgi:hypothetical protein